MIAVTGNLDVSEQSRESIKLAAAVLAVVPQVVTFVVADLSGNIKLLSNSQQASLGAAEASLEVGKNVREADENGGATRATLHPFIVGVHVLETVSKAIGSKYSRDQRTDARLWAVTKGRRQIGHPKCTSKKWFSSSSSHWARNPHSWHTKWTYSICRHTSPWQLSHGEIVHSRQTKTVWAMCSASSKTFRKTSWHRGHHAWRWVVWQWVRIASRPKKVRLQSQHTKVSPYRCTYMPKTKDIVEGRTSLKGGSEARNGTKDVVWYVLR